ncbi:MAG: hypothetical protein ACHRXM_22560 [Isosphaerales bacterium]
MRLARLRFTLRQMMVAVAVAAGTLASRGYLLHLAATEDVLDRENTSHIQALLARSRICVDVENPTPLSEHHARLKRAYELAALYPWVVLALVGSLPLCSMILGRIQNKFRLSLRGLMGAVAIPAILLAMLVPTARMRVDWENARIEDFALTGSLMLAETILLYYSVLAAVMALGLIDPAERVGRVRRIFVYGPVLVIIALVALLEVLDALERRR